MNIGFTGTRKGMNELQKKKLMPVIWEYSKHPRREVVLLHGCCYGADAQAVELLVPMVQGIVAYPSNLPDTIDTRALVSSQAIHPPKPPLERNRNIVSNSHLLIACPAENSEVLRSGTWATIRYARKMGIETVIITPIGICSVYSASRRGAD